MDLRRATAMKNRTSQVNDCGARMSRRNTKLTALAVTILVIAMSLGSTLGSAAFAQDKFARQSRDRSSDPRYRAPIGARQPRQQDLSPAVLRDEGHVTPSQRNFDKSLQICRQC